jgi:Rrf2 family protein
MNISVKGEYALQALIDLAAQTPGEPVKIADIARRQRIPQKFLELILAGLKQGGFVESRRGAEGGYLLARAADSLTVGDVLRFVEGPQPRLRPGRTRSQPPPGVTAGVPSGLPSGPDNPFSDMWEQVDRAVSEILDKTTFGDILRGWSEKQNQYVLNWEI